MKANDHQVGGRHYARGSNEVQHWDGMAKVLGFQYHLMQASKYLYRNKNDMAEDYLKAAHYLEKAAEVAREIGTTLADVYGDEWSVETAMMQEWWGTTAASKFEYQASELRDKSSILKGPPEDIKMPPPPEPV